MKKLLSKNRAIPIVCFFGYAIWQLFIIVRFQGMYSYDETYHVFAANDYYNSISSYDRAPYINKLISLFSNIFGRSYYVYKSIPYILSLISVGLLLYVLYQYVQRSFSIVLFTVLVALHSSILFINIYIRMYVFDEALMAVAAFILVRMSMTESRVRKCIAILLYIVASFVLMAFQPREQSSWLLAIICLTALIGNWLGGYAIEWAAQHKKQILLIVIMSVCVVGVAGLFVAVKNGIIELPFYVVHIEQNNEYPWLLRHVLKGNLLICIGMLHMGIRLVYNKYERKSNLLGIYLLGLIPLLLFLIVYYDNFILRVLSVYLPCMVLITAIWIDSIKPRIVSGVVIGALYIFNIYKSQADLDIVSYMHSPYIQWEAAMNDYGGMVADTKAAIGDGRKCICFWKSRNDMSMFDDLTTIADENLCLEDDNNKLLGNVDAEVLHDVLDRLEQTDDKYVVMIAPIVESRIANTDFPEVYCPEFLETLKERYEYKQYTAQSFCGVFYVN
ncbi:MAG: hypothetical protein KBT19_09620 [Lachnospiraceae bacterium]|nr:hypothetical protein [Candidatus Colinaster equi]